MARTTARKLAKGVVDGLKDTMDGKGGKLAWPAAGPPSLTLVEKEDNEDKDSSAEHEQPTDAMIVDRPENASYKSRSLSTSV